MIIKILFHISDSFKLLLLLRSRPRHELVCRPQLFKLFQPLIECILEIFILLFDIPDELLDRFKSVSLSFDLCVSLIILEFPLLKLLVDHIFVRLKLNLFGPLVSFDLPAVGAVALIDKARFLVSILGVKFLLRLLYPMLVF